ncbi:trace amine-associated receptor 8-like [Acropora muricata]|uniref:trace amine-associated receptor 8-like n=1 Tax=Acropora muricata TaxID=159855 RepID=UPI0034E3F7B6
MVSFLNTTSSYTTNGSADQTHQDNQGNVIASIVLLASGLVGCTVALLALGKDFFEGKNPPTVCIGALVWVDFVGVFSTAVLIFNGIVKGEDWLKGFPQCSLQGFFTTAFGLSSGVVVTFMSLDRVVSLNSPFLYSKYATPRLARGSCLLLVTLCIALGALPFVNVGDYVLNETSRSSCHFNWFPVERAGKVFLFTMGSFGALLASVMTFSNIFVFIVVVRIKRRMSKLFPCDQNSRRHARQGAFRQEERMAKFVALAAVVFLFTWLPVTIRIFCNAFRVFPSQHMDEVSTKLVIVNFILDPLMYVLFKGRFRKKLRLSLNEMTEFIGEVNIGQKLRKQTVRVEDAAAEDRNISAIGPAGCSAQSPVVRVADGPAIVNLALDSVTANQSEAGATDR